MLFWTGTGAPIKEDHEEITILAVDDEPDVVELTAELLEREDERFTIVTETSASDGIERLVAADIDCVVSDYDMPRLNGLEFLRTVREEDSNLPFILYTGKGSEEIASDAISVGVTDYLQKGSGTERYELLANRINTAVSQYRTESQLERQNELFAKAQDIANVGAWEYDPQTEEAYFSDEVYDIYGVGRDHESSPEKDIQRFYHPEDRDTVREAVRKALESGEGYDIEVRLTAADGTYKWVRTRADPYLADGEVVKVRGTIRDITCVGVYLLARVFPPRHVFADIQPNRILFGHGAPIENGSADTLADALSSARRRFPHALATNGWTQLRALVAALN